MKKLFPCLFLFLIICCSEKDDPLSTTLEVNLISDSTISIDEELIISIEIKNADSLFAVSLELHYSSQLFETNSSTVTIGNLFSDPTMYELSTEGEVGVTIGELGDIQFTSSGIVCHVTLLPKNEGTDLIYVSSLHMIEPDGTSIDGFSALSIEPIEVNVVE